MIEYQFCFQSGGVRAGVCSDQRLHPEVVRPIQTHSFNIAIIDEYGDVPDLDATDSIISFRRGLRIGVRTADCVPLVIYAADLRAVAAVHAGWRGSIGGIASKTVRKLIELGAAPEKMEVAFGPSICGNCYEISEDLSDRFRNSGYSGSFVSYRHIDLESVNRKQLMDEGILLERIHGGCYCTYETLDFPSWRRQSTDLRLLTWIELL